MVYGAISLLVIAVIISFAVIGVRQTLREHPGLHGMLFVRDFFKYFSLFASVLISCLGISGILMSLLDYQQGLFISKLDLARWMSFSVIGTPLVILIYRSVIREFERDAKGRNSPVWHVYLLLTTVVSLLLWFLPLQNALRAFSGSPISSRAISSSLVSFFVWVIHINLLRGYKTLVTNFQFFVGTFIGFTGVAMSLISFVDSGISTLIGLGVGKFQISEAIILFITATPLSIFYFGEVVSRASLLEIRIFNTFGGMFISIILVSIAAIFTLNRILLWFFGETRQTYNSFFSDLPSAIGVVVTLGLYHLIFRGMAYGFKRDQLTRIYQYLVSATTLAAGSFGFGALVVGLLGAQERMDSIILGASVILVTCPNWLYHWRFCQASLTEDYELGSTTAPRRFYLYFFIGVPSIVGIGSLVWLTYNLFKALLVGNQQLWQSRYPISALITALTLSLYHFYILRRERILR